MKAPTPIANKIQNALNFIGARPYLYVPPQVRSILEKVAAGLEITAEEAAKVVKWYQKGQGSIPLDVFKQLVGREAGLAWFKALAKTAKPQIEEFMPKAEPVVEKHIVHESVGVAGRNGWTPTFTSHEENDKIYIFVDWVNGQGTKPDSGFISPSGLTNDLDEATVFAGGTGAGLNVRYTAVDTLITPLDDIVIATASCTISLPLASTQEKSYQIKSKTDGDVTVLAEAPDKIDGEDTQVINIKYYSIKIIPEAEGWGIF